MLEILLVFIAILIAGVLPTFLEKRKSDLTKHLKMQIPNYEQCLMFTWVTTKKHERARYYIDKELLLLYNYDCAQEKLTRSDIKKITKCELILNDNAVQTISIANLQKSEAIGEIVETKISNFPDKVTKGEIILYCDDIQNPEERLFLKKGKKDIKDEIILFYTTLCVGITKSKISTNKNIVTADTPEFTFSNRPSDEKLNL